MPEFLVVWKEETTGAEFVKGWRGARDKVRELARRPTHPLIYVFMSQEIDAAMYLALGLTESPEHE